MILVFLSHIQTDLLSARHDSPENGDLPECPLIALSSSVGDFGADAFAVIASVWPSPTTAEMTTMSEMMVPSQAAAIGTSKMKKQQMTC